LYHGRIDIVTVNHKFPVKGRKGGNSTKEYKTFSKTLVPKVVIIYLILPVNLTRRSLNA